MRIYYHDGNWDRQEPLDNDDLSGALALLSTDVQQLANLVRERYADLAPLIDIVAAQSKLIKAQGELIRDLYSNLQAIAEDLHDLAPDKEIIDVMFDDEEERRQALAKYMNHGDYTDDSN